MRNFFSSHWKAILAILLATMLATLTFDTSPREPPLAARRQAQVGAVEAWPQPAKNISCRSFKKRCPNSVGLISLWSR